MRENYQKGCGLGIIEGSFWSNFRRRIPVLGGKLGYVPSVPMFSAGNMTGNGSASYVYDAENRLIWSTSILGSDAYLYDGNGQRVEKCVAATSTTVCPTTGTNGTLYWKGTGSETLDESDLSGNALEEYIFLNGQRIARRDVSTNLVHYYFSDHLGSHGVVENATGTLCEQDIDFYPYGGVEYDYCGTTPQNYKFTGKERDSESLLDNFGARYDASSLGRFMTSDPSGLSFAEPSNPQSLNLYAYVQNNPLVFVDSNGLEVAPAAQCGWFSCLLSNILKFFANGGSGDGGGPPVSPFQNLLSHYPRYSQYPSDPKNGHPTIWELAGGHVLANEKIFVNSCAIRLCEALNKSGYKIPHLPRTSSDADHDWDFRSLTDLQPFLIQQFGKPEHYVTNGANSWRGHLAGRTGILLFQVNIWSDATGHATLWDGQNLADGGVHDYTKVSTGVLFWPIQ